MDRRLSIGAKVAGGAFAAIGVPSGIGFFVDKLQPTISRVSIGADHAGVKLPAGSYMVSYWGLFLVALLIAAVLLMGAWIWLGLGDARIRTNEARAQAALAEAERSQNERAIQEAQAQVVRGQAAAAQADFAMRTAYDQVCRAIRRVVYNSYNPVDPSAEPPPHLSFVRIDCTFDVNANGDARVTQEYEVKCGPSGARFWTLRLDADQYAEPFATLRSIDFDASTSVAGQEVVALPIDNDGANRSVALFFLPEPQAGETRTFRIVFNWPKWFGELPATGMTDWRWSYRSLENAGRTDVTFRFRFANDYGSITAENTHYEVAGEKLDLVTEPQGACWTYRSPRHPAARLNWVIRFRKG